jgi:hypothetical protein
VAVPRQGAGPTTRSWALSGSGTQDLHCTKMYACALVFVCLRGPRIQEQKYNKSLSRSPPPFIKQPPPPSLTPLWLLSGRTVNPNGAALAIKKKSLSGQRDRPLETRGLYLESTYVPVSQLKVRRNTAGMCLTNRTTAAPLSLARSTRQDHSVSRSVHGSHSSISSLNTNKY